MSESWSNFFNDLLRSWPILLAAAGAIFTLVHLSDMVEIQSAQLDAERKRNVELHSGLDRQMAAMQEAINQIHILNTTIQERQNDVRERLSRVEQRLQSGR